MRTIFLRLTSDALRVRSFYGCVANYAKNKIKSSARKFLLMEGWVASLTMRPNNCKKYDHAAITPNQAGQIELNL
jgi:hypothetical protein